MKNKVLSLLLLIVGFFHLANANSIGTPEPPAPKNTPPPPGLPIDNFAYALLFLGLFLGFYFLKYRSNKIVK